MRDLLIISLVVLGSLAALRRPWIGVLVWTWLSIMNPHRYAFGPAYDAPLAALAAGSTLLGVLFTKDKTSPFKGSPVVWFILFMVWITLSWLLGLNPDGDYEQWSKVMKIDVMILVALMLIHSKKQILLLMWVAVGSLALLGAKGGIFTIMNGGSYRVWGPPGSFIADNNEFALALVMTVPLLRFLQLQLSSTWLRRLLLALMLLCAASALGSQSRGALIAITLMALFLWLRSHKKLVPGLMIVLAAAALVAFMPDSWDKRMNSIQNYEEDRSAMGRISAWWVAWRVAQTYFAGVGFNPARADLFQRFSPYPDYVHAAHSIYFQVMGNHGFIGLLLFIAVFVATWRIAGGLRRDALAHPEARWCVDLASMTQVALVAYASGGAFLSLAYFDLPYNLMVMVVAARVWLDKRAWLQETQQGGWLMRMLGVVPRRPPQPAHRPSAKGLAP